MELPPNLSAWAGFAEQAIQRRPSPSTAGTKPAGKHDSRLPLAPEKVPAPGSPPLAESRPSGVAAHGGATASVASPAVHVPPAPARAALARGALSAISSHLRGESTRDTLLRRRAAHGSTQAAATVPVPIAFPRIATDLRPAAEPFEPTTYTNATIDIVEANPLHVAPKEDVVSPETLPVRASVAVLSAEVEPYVPLSYAAVEAETTVSTTATVECTIQVGSAAGPDASVIDAQLAALARFRDATRLLEEAYFRVLHQGRDGPPPLPPPLPPPPLPPLTYEEEHRAAARLAAKLSERPRKVASRAVKVRGASRLLQAQQMCSDEGRKSPVDGMSAEARVANAVTSAREWRENLACLVRTNIAGLLCQDSGSPVDSASVPLGADRMRALLVALGEWQQVVAASSDAISAALPAAPTPLSLLAASIETGHFVLAAAAVAELAKAPPVGASGRAGDVGADCCPVPSVAEAVLVASALHHTAAFTQHTAASLQPLRVQNRASHRRLAVLVASHEAAMLRKRNAAEAAMKEAVAAAAAALALREADAASSGPPAAVPKPHRKRLTDAAPAMPGMLPGATPVSRPILLLRRPVPAPTSPDVPSAEICVVQGSAAPAGEEVSSPAELASLSAGGQTANLDKLSAAAADAHGAVGALETALGPTLWQMGALTAGSLIAMGRDRRSEPLVAACLEALAGLSLLSREAQAARSVVTAAGLLLAARGGRAAEAPLAAPADAEVATPLPPLPPPAAAVLAAWHALIPASARPLALLGTFIAQQSQLAQPRTTAPSAALAADSLWTAPCLFQRALLRISSAPQSATSGNVSDAVLRKNIAVAGRRIAKERNRSADDDPPTATAQAGISEPLSSAAGETIGVLDSSGQSILALWARLQDLGSGLSSLLRPAVPVAPAAAGVPFGARIARATSATAATVCCLQDVLICIGSTDSSAAHAADVGALLLPALHEFEAACAAAPAEWLELLGGPVVVGLRRAVQSQPAVAKAAQQELQRLSEALRLALTSASETVEVCCLGTSRCVSGTASSSESRGDSEAAADLACAAAAAGGDSPPPVMAAPAATRNPLASSSAAAAEASARANAAARDYLVRLWTHALDGAASESLLCTVAAAHGIDVRSRCVVLPAVQGALGDSGVCAVLQAAVAATGDDHGPPASLLMASFQRLMKVCGRAVVTSPPVHDARQLHALCSTVVAIAMETGADIVACDVSSGSHCICGAGVTLDAIAASAPSLHTVGAEIICPVCRSPTDVSTGAPAVKEWGYLQSIFALNDDGAAAVTASEGACAAGVPASKGRESATKAAKPRGAASRRQGVRADAVPTSQRSAGGKAPAAALAGPGSRGAATSRRPLRALAASTLTPATATVASAASSSAPVAGPRVPLTRQAAAPMPRRQASSASVTRQAAAASSLASVPLLTPAALASSIAELNAMAAAASAAASRPASMAARLAALHRPGRPQQTAPLIRSTAAVATLASASASSSTPTVNNILRRPPPAAAAGPSSSSSSSRSAVERSLVAFTLTDAPTTTSASPGGVTGLVLPSLSDGLYLGGPGFVSFGSDADATYTLQRAPEAPPQLLQPNDASAASLSLPEIALPSFDELRAVLEAEEAPTAAVVPDFGRWLGFGSEALPGRSRAASSASGNRRAASGGGADDDVSRVEGAREDPEAEAEEEEEEEAEEEEDEAEEEEDNGGGFALGTHLLDDSSEEEDGSCSDHGDDDAGGEVVEEGEAAGGSVPPPPGIAAEHQQPPQQHSTHAAAVAAAALSQARRDLAALTALWAQPPRPGNAMPDESPTAFAPAALFPAAGAPYSAAVSVPATSLQGSTSRAAGGIAIGPPPGLTRC